MADGKIPSSRMMKTLVAESSMDGSRTENSISVPQDTDSKRHTMMMTPMPEDEGRDLNSESWRQVYQNQTPQVATTPPVMETPTPKMESYQEVYGAALAFNNDSFDGNEIFDNRYQVEEALGEGGMGMVCRVRCLRLGKQFALKRMLASIAHNQKLRDTFYQEARLASSLTHPNIVSIVDYGEDPQHGAYMVMELVQGEMLSKRLAKGPVPTRTMTDVILQIADALKHIHSKGIVHGDIKPDNILLHRAKHSDRRRWQVMLLDFGLASLRSNEATKSSRVSGTPQYMAPERIQGAPPAPSHDIYALGILAYQLTTGRLPFDGNVQAILTAHLTMEPPPFCAFLATDVDPRLEALIFKAIAKEPEARHPNMAAFIYELRTLVDMLGLDRKRGGFKQVQSANYLDARDKSITAACSGFHDAPVPLAVVSADGVIQAINRAFLRFLDADAKDMKPGTSVATDRFIHRVPTLLKEVRRTQAVQECTTLAVQVQQRNVTSNLRISLTPTEDNTVLLAVQVDSYE